MMIEKTLSGKALSLRLSGRITTKLNLSVQAATMMRILSLPADFFKQWSSGELASRYQQLQYNPPLFLRMNSVISTAISLAGTFVMYALAMRSGVGVADYYAFNAAYGMDEAWEAAEMAALPKIFAACLRACTLSFRKAAEESPAGSVSG